MNSIPLKIGIVGCGNIAKVHLKYIVKYIDPENIAVCDRDHVRLEDFANSNHISHKYDNIETMCLFFKPDVVHILTPPFTHKGIALQCMNAGVNVLIEKPMCLDEDEADEIIATAQNNDVRVCTNHMRMFDPLLLRVQEILEFGEVGEIANIYGCYSHDLMEKKDSDSTAKWMVNLKGGMLFDVSPHLVYILDEFLPGLKFDHVETVCKQSGEVLGIVASGSSGIGTGIIHLALNIFPLQNYVRFDCTRGVIKIDFRNYLITVRKRSGLPNAVERLAGNISEGWQIISGTICSIFNFVSGRLDPYGGTDVIIREFYAALMCDGISPVPAEKGRALVKLTHQIFSQVSETMQGKEIRINTLKDEADVLVTGGTGFIGKALVRRLFASGRRIRIFTHQDPSVVKEIFPDIKELDIIKGDIYCYGDVLNACRGVGTVYHLAAAMKGDWNYFLDTTITGTKNMLRAIDEVGVKQLIYVSTLNVLDAKNFPHNGTITEEFNYENHPERRGNYSNAKLQTERLVLEAVNTTKTRIILLRPGLVYGPCGTLFPMDVGIRIGKKLVACIGMGNRKIPFVYVDNLVDALMLTENSSGKSGSIYNVVDNDYPTQNDYIRLYKQLTNEKFITIRIPLWFIIGTVSILEGMLKRFTNKTLYISYKFTCIRKSVVHSTQRIESECNWKQKVHFHEGLLAHLECENGIRL